MAKIRAIICYKNFKAIPGVSHVGLGVSAENNIRTLKDLGIDIEVKALNSDLDFLPLLRLAQKEGNPYTHVIISALWVRTGVVDELCVIFKDTRFIVNCHSAVAFLQSEPGAIRLIREQIKLQDTRHNFNVAGNSHKFVEFIRNAYRCNCLYLPNMYLLSPTQPPKRKHWNGDLLRIGMYGAIRVQKNFISGAAVALELHKKTGAKKTELWINGGRKDTSDTERLIKGIEELTKDVVGFELHNAGWLPWEEFAIEVAKNDLLLQPSTTETHNIVTCDGIANGVPSLVSPAINWAPKNWKANPDDIEEMTEVAYKLLFDRKATIKGYRALEKHNRESLRAWLDFFEASGVDSFWTSLF
jgi:hypothetical protein